MPSFSLKLFNMLTFPSKVESPLELTSNIGTPDISATANMLPLRLSVTENNWPCDPATLNTVPPLLYTSNLAVGLASPMPTLPLFTIVNLLSEFLAS